MRNRFAKRCWVGNSLVFITMVITIAKVIHTPPQLLVSTSNRSDGNGTRSNPEKSKSKPVSEVSITKATSVEDNIKNNSSSKITSQKNDGNNVKVSDTSHDSVNVKEPNKIKNNTENNENVTKIPAACKGLEIIDDDAYEDEPIHWWLTMNSFKGRDIYIIYV